MTFYFQTLEDAESRRRKGEKIYYKPGYGYYIVKLRKRDWKEDYF